MEDGLAPEEGRVGGLRFRGFSAGVDPRDEEVDFFAAELLAKGCHELVDGGGDFCEIRGLGEDEGAVELIGFVGGVCALGFFKPLRDEGFVEKTAGFLREDAAFKLGLEFGMGDVCGDQTVVLDLVAVEGDVEAHAALVGGLAQVADPGCVDGELLGPRGAVEGVHSGHDIVGKAGLGEPLVPSGDHRALEVAEFLDVELHLHDHTKVATTGAAEGPEESAFLRGGRVGFADGDEGAVGSDQGGFGEGVGAHAEATREGAEASAKDEATNANGRITTTVDDIAVVVAYD